MSQSNYNIPNQSAPAVRAQLNSVFGSIATNNSGSAAPSTTFAHQWWYDTSTDILKMRNAANSAWINVAYFDQAGGAFRILDDTQVTDTSGVQTGLLGDQDTATWEAGTGTLESLVSPAKVAAVVVALAPNPLLSIANAVEGGVGTLVFAKRNISTDVNFGGTVAGSSLLPVSAMTSGGQGSWNTTASGGSLAGSALSGTWRCLGRYDYTWDISNTTQFGATLWMRIS